MKSTPILMSAPMVRAILNGTKRQTRRIANPQPHSVFRSPSSCIYIDDKGVDLKCRYGKPGDELWVKETWYDDLVRPAKSIPERDGHIYYRAGDNVGVNKWRPSIFMPRTLSRITLRITDVRVERLQDISEEDAIAEGIDRDAHQCPCEICFHTSAMCTATASGVIEAYASLWRSINGPDSWALNPWVWNLAFERIEK